MKLTIKEFAEKIGVEYVVASSVLRFMVDKGQAVVVGKITKGRGKPTLVYEVPEKVEISL